MVAVINIVVFGNSYSLPLTQLQPCPHLLDEHIRPRVALHGHWQTEGA